jgi:mono/diheme cytochrome c family protein
MMGVHLRMLAPALLAATALFAAGCGGGDDNGGGPPSGVAAPGAKVWDDAGCGSCHTLAAADATGKTGPSLDEVRPTAERVERQVRNGGNGMPSFDDRLSDEEIRQVADFVATSAGSGSGSGGGAAKKITFEPDDTKLESCPDDPSCYQQAFGNLAFEDGPKAALDRLQSMQQRPVVQTNCHSITHMIGAGGLRHFDGEIGKAFVAGNSTCGSGYYHGLLQWKLAGLDEEEVGPVAREACDDPEIRANNFIYYQCVHGLGHGVMLYTGLELPIALRLCHELETEFDQTSCSGGVFMENLSSSFGLRTRWLKDDNLLYPCNIVSRQDKLYCYLLVSSRILPAVGWNWEKAADWCRKSDKDFIDICFQSYGRDVSGKAVRDPVLMRRYCARAGSGERECLFGAARDMLNNDANDLRARELCSAVKRKHRAYCFYGLGTIIGTQHADAAGRRQACSRFARGRDLADCIQGAGS